MLRDFVVVAVVGSIIAGLHQTCAAGAVSQRQQRTGAQAELDVPHFSLDDLLSDDDFAETEFIVLSQHEATRESAHTEASNGVEVDMATFEVHSHGDSAMTQRNSAAGNGVVCETVCRPRTASASDEGPPSDDTSEASSSFLELNSDSDGDDVSMLQQRVRSLIEALQIQQAEQVAVLARSFNRSLCAASGGGWDSERSVCAPFMHASPTTVASCDGTRVFEACSGDFVDGNGVAHAGGSVGDYVPCSPFQALALAHVQQDSVPEQVRVHDAGLHDCKRCCCVCRSNSPIVRARARVCVCGSATL